MSTTYDVFDWAAKILSVIRISGVILCMVILKGVSTIIKFAELLSKAILAVGLLLLLGCMCPANSGVFMVMIPLAYYFYRRIVLPRFTQRLIRATAMAGLLALLVICLPTTRKAIAGFYFRAYVNAAREDYSQEATRLFVRATQWKNDHPEILYEKFKYAFSTEDVGQAIHWLARAVENGRDDPDALYQLARLYAKTGAHNKEICLYHQILESEPFHPEANYCMAAYYHDVQRDTRKAIEHLQKARDSLPKGNPWTKRCDQILNQLSRKP